MQTTQLPLPPLALALGRLRQPRPAPRAWPFAPRPADALAPEPGPREPDHDFLRLLPEPALTGDLPPPRPETARIPGPEAARTYWFDL